MKQIPNSDCSFTDLWVSVKNWRSATSRDLSKVWYIQCMYFDPRFKEKYPKGYPFRKRFNKFKSLSERKQVVSIALTEIPDLFLSGYNPISQTFMFGDGAEDQYQDITPQTPFVMALQFAYDQRKPDKDMKSIFKFVKLGAEKLRIDAIPISEVKRKHIRFIIDYLEKTEGAFSEHKFNKYRTYLQMLFKILLEYEAVEHNIITGITKKVTENKPRETLTMDQRKQVDEFLKLNYPDFHRFVLILFHSGGRITELLRLQAKDVDLEKQVYRTFIRKGKLRTWVERPLKDISMPIWNRCMLGAKPDDFIFSEGLRPGANQIGTRVIGRRWKSHVKDKLGITADLYSLKHSNLDEIARELDVTHAARLAGHTSNQMVIGHYAVGEREREMERIKRIGNSFA